MSDMATVRSVAYSVSAVVLGVLLGLWLGLSGILPDPPPFRQNCDKHGGVVAEHHFGKSHQWFCIVGNRVIDHE